MLQALKRDKAFYRYLVSLTAPIALQNLITFSLGLIDTLMVSRLGNNEMAAVTAANVPVFLLISIVFGVQSGVGILISQYWGKKDLTSISRVIGVAAFLGVSLALIVAVVLFAWPVAIMDLLSNKHHLSLLGAPYLRLIGFSYVFNMLSSIYVSAQRSVENAGFGMKLFGMSTVMNTGLNYLLIFGKCGFPALGVEGAALATLLSRVAEFIVCLICALRSKRIPLDLRALLRPGWEMLRRFVKYASPVLLNELLWGLGNSLLTVILGHTTVSVEFLAANGVMGNLNRLFLVVCFGLGAATAVMIGKAIGEGQSHDELMALAKTLSWVTILVGAVLAVVALVQCLIMAGLVLAVRKPYLETMKQPGRYWKVLWIIPSAFFAINYSAQTWPSDLIETPSNAFTCIVSSLTMMICYAMLFQLFDMWRKEQKLAEDNRFLDAYAQGLRHEMETVRMAEERDYDLTTSDNDLPVDIEALIFTIRDKYSYLFA